MTLPRYSKAGARIACGALLLGSAIAAASLVPAEASPARTGEPLRRTVTVPNAKYTSAPAEPSGTGSIAKAPEQPGACDGVRKRFWIEGEGWIVRRVCR